MRAFSEACSLPVMWQDGGNTIQSAIVYRPGGKPHAAALKLPGCMFYRTWVITNRSCTLQQYAFSIFLAPVTLTLTWWPSYTNLTRILRRYAVCAKMNILYVKAFESYRIIKGGQWADVVTRVHFRSRDKGGIRSAVVKTRCHMQTSWLYLL